MTWRKTYKVLEKTVNEFGLSKREQLFIDMVRRVVSEDGCATQRQLVRAAIESDGNLIKYGEDKAALQKRRAMRKVRKYLSNPKIAEAIQDIYALQDFDVNDAIKKHIEHIREGNYQALKDYLSMTLPQPTKRLQIQQQTAILHANVSDTQERMGPPPMAPRSIGPAKVEHES